MFASALFWAYLVWEHAEDFSKNLLPLLADALSPSQRFANGTLAAIMALALRILWPLYDTRMLKEEGPNRVFSGGSCWADLPMHMTVAESFINGRNQDVSWSQMIAPVFAGSLSQPLSVPCPEFPPSHISHPPPPLPSLTLLQARPWPTLSCLTSTQL